MKKKVLFICVHNSARSQMAEAIRDQIRQRVEPFCDHECVPESHA